MKKIITSIIVLAFAVLSVSAQNNANVQTKIEGYYEQEKQYIANKSFTVTVREKGKVYTK